MNVVLVFHDDVFEQIIDKTWSDPEHAREFAAGVECGGSFLGGGLSAYAYPADESRLREEIGDPEFGRPREAEKAIVEAKKRLDADVVDRTKLTPYRQKLADEGHCMADADGDCVWKGCPQIRDGEPMKSGRSCPRWVETRRRLDPDDEGRAGG